MMRARSSACWISSANHFIRMAWRSLAVLARQAGQAAPAARIAASACAAPRLATCASVIPVAGSDTAKRASPAIHSPSISASVLSNAASFSVESGEVFMSMGSSVGLQASHRAL
jgi:hypothetical protein